MPKYNPFRPSGIVAPGMFSGRLEELESLEKVLVQTKNDNAEYFLIRGERGIGKSSLLFYLQRVADGSITSIDDETFRFLTLPIEIDSSMSYESLIRKVVTELHDKMSVKQAWLDRAKKVVEFLGRWEVGGVKYNPDQNELQRHELLDDLVRMLGETISDLGGDADGILVLIDEADKAAPGVALGETLKLLTERLTKRGCNRVSIGLAGLPDVVNVLARSHASSPRIFKHLSLAPLSLDERRRVIRLGLDEAERRNGFATQITKEAENSIAIWSEGYPHFIQQFSYSAFDHDTDNTIDQSDFLAGAFSENGALRQLGIKYFEGLYFEQIGSDEYRQVLKVMSRQRQEWVTKDQIRESAGLKPTTLNNAISALLRRNIIVAKPGSKGVYKLPSVAFEAWVRAFTEGDLPSPPPT